MPEKDAAGKQLYEIADVFADIANVLLFDGKEIIAPEDLRPETPSSAYNGEGTIHGQERDVAKVWVKENVRIAFFGLENESQSEKDMPLRIISYDGAAYRQQLNRDKSRREAGLARERYPVITLVLYFNYEEKWNTAKSLKECINIPRELEPFVSDYKINVVDVAWLSDETIAKFKSDFRIVADFYSQMRKNRDYVPTPAEVQNVKAVLDLFTALSRAREFRELYIGNFEGDASNMEGFVEYFFNRGKTEGEKKGKAEGKAEGESLMSKMVAFLLRDNKMAELKEITTNVKKRRELYLEYGLLPKADAV